MAEKVYLTSDQYVVKLLQQKEQELYDLNEKYNELLARFVKLQVENKKFEQVKQWFSLEETKLGSGYQLLVRDDDGEFRNTVAYCWNKKEPKKEFLELLELLGLSLPKEPKED